MSVILGIDLGTSSVKAMLLDSVKGVISVESSPYEVSIPFEGYAEQNPETWWLETKQVLGRLRDKNEQEFNEIQAVGFFQVRCMESWWQTVRESLLGQLFYGWTSDPEKNWSPLTACWISGNGRYLETGHLPDLPSRPLCG